MGRAWKEGVALAAMCLFFSGVVLARSEERLDDANPEPVRSEVDGAGAMTLPRPAEDARPAQNAVYGEAFGAAVFLSVNYERMLGDGIAARIGIGPGFISTISGRGERSALDFLVPMTVSYAAIGSDRHKLELGGGATMLHVTAAADSGGLLGYHHSGFGFYGDAFAGYRYQPPHGFTLRAGVNALIAFPDQAWPVIPWPYLALGGSF